MRNTVVYTLMLVTSLTTLQILSRECGCDCNCGPVVQIDEGCCESSDKPTTTGVPPQTDRPPTDEQTTNEPTTNEPTTTEEATTDTTEEVTPTTYVLTPADITVVQGDWAMMQQSVGSKKLVIKALNRVFDAKPETLTKYFGDIANFGSPYDETNIAMNIVGTNFGNAIDTLMGTMGTSDFDTSKASLSQIAIGFGQTMNSGRSSTGVWLAITATLHTEIGEGVDIDAWKRVFDSQIDRPISAIGESGPQ